MKYQLRKEMLEKRKTMAKSEIVQKSKLIMQRLYKLVEFNLAQTILFYISYDNEVYTHDMIKETLTTNKLVIVPVSDIKKNQLILSELHSWGHRADSLALFLWVSFRS